MSKLSLEVQLEELLSESMVSVMNREQSAFDVLTAPFSESLVLFGAGNLGRKTLAGLRGIGIEPLAFADNNSALWEKYIDGVQVLSAQEAAQRFGHRAAFVITIWRAVGGDRFAQRREQLLTLNCRKVVPFGYLFWKYPKVFLPHYGLDVPHKIYQHTDELRKVFQLWANDDSRHEYLAQLRFRMLMDFDGLPSPVTHKQYFPDDLFSLSPDEVFVDCGAFDGDTIRDLLQRRKSSFGSIIALEPDPVNFRELQAYISTLPDLVKEQVLLLQLAAGACRGKVLFNAKGTVQSAVSEAGTIEVESAPLDEILDSYSPTFIKMDIEGAELDALNGARHSIERDLPILATCVYHRPDHLWHIPLLIRSFSEQYRFFLRPHDEEGWDLVCYAIPASRLIAAPSER